MKVLVFVDEYDYAHYTFIYNEIKSLQSKGIEILVVCDRIGALKQEDTNFQCIPMTGNWFFRNLYLWAYNRNLSIFYRYYGYFTERVKIIKSFKPDLIHIHFGLTAVKLFDVLRAHFVKFPCVVTFHGFDASALLQNESYVRRLRKMLNENVRSIIVSENLINNLASHGLYKADKASLLYYGIRIDLFERTKTIGNEVKRFLQISSFVEKKGHKYTLLAFRKFIDKSPRKAVLVLGGDGPLKKEIELMSAALGLSDHVSFSGWVSRQQCVELMNEADYFVHHSVTSDSGDQEGLPNSIIEAMAMELPIISTFHSGIPELVADKVNGFLVQEKDIEEYAKRMEDVLSWRFLKTNRNKIMENFSLEKHTIDLVNIYKNTIGQSL